MKLKKILKTTFALTLCALVLIYLWALVTRSEGIAITGSADKSAHRTVAVFGATGTIGDGLLKAALADPDVGKVYAVTRRPSARIEAGVAAGKVTMITHSDYLDYGDIIDDLADVDAVFWAIGLSAVGMEEDAYREIHLAFPMRFVDEWMSKTARERVSFHYVSGAGASDSSGMMWAREKARAEAKLFAFSEGRNLRVVAYRPSFILPTETEAHLGHRILFALFSPIRMAVAAVSIGQAMLETAARREQFGNGSILDNADILNVAEAYREGDGRQ